MLGCPLIFAGAEGGNEGSTGTRLFGSPGLTGAGQGLSFGRRGSSLGGASIYPDRKIPSLAECRSLPESAGCDARAECVDQRFAEILQTRPERVCEKNSRAQVDRELARRAVFASLGVGPDPDSESLCRASYAKLHRAIASYKNEVRVGCQNVMAVTAQCSGKENLNQTEVADCIRRATQAANDAETKAIQELEEDLKTVEERVRPALQSAQEQYRKDHEAIESAGRVSSCQEDFGASPAAGIESHITSCLRYFKQQSRAIVGGRFELEATAARPRANEAVLPVNSQSTIAINGGASNLEDYEARLPQLRAEQKQAEQAIDRFGALVREERKNLTSMMGQITQISATSSTRGDRMGSVEKGSNSGISGGSNLPSVANLEKAMALAGASAKLVGQLQGGTGGSQPLSLSGASAVGREGLGGTSPTPSSGLAARDKGFGSSSSETRKDKADSGRSPAQADPLGKGLGSPSGSELLLGSGRARGQKGRNDSGGLGEATGADSFGSRSGGKGSGGGGSAFGKDGGDSLASSGKKGDAAAGRGTAEGGACPPGAADCGGSAGGRSASFGGGLLGAALVGLPDLELSPNGALQDLLGPGAELQKELGMDAKLGALPNSYGGLGDDGLGSAQGDGAEVLAAPVNHSLFSRIHRIHERAVKRGTVILYQKKL